MKNNEQVICNLMVTAAWENFSVALQKVPPKAIVLSIWTRSSCENQSLLINKCGIKLDKHYSTIPSALLRISVEVDQCLFPWLAGKVAELCFGIYTLVWDWQKSGRAFSVPRPRHPVSTSRMHRSRTARNTLFQALSCWNLLFCYILIIPQDPNNKWQQLETENVKFW